MHGVPRIPLVPKKALKLFHSQIESVRSVDDEDIVLELCLDAVSTLARIEESERKTLLSSTAEEDKALCQNIAAAFNEIARIFDRLGRSRDAQRTDKIAGKWGYNKGGNTARQGSSSSVGRSTNNISSNNKKEKGATINNSKSRKATEATESSTTLNNNKAIPKGIFDHEVAQVTFKYSPHNNQRPLNRFSLIPNSPILMAGSSGQGQEKSLTKSDDQDEHNLASDVMAIFVSGKVKVEATVAEVVSLAPILSHDQYKKLLMALVNGISQNTILDVHLMEGLSQLVQRAPPGYFKSDDLIIILNTLSSRLQETHNQSDDSLHRLSTTVSHVLDAMINNQMRALKRGHLHEPLSAYLNGP
ncbi:hypothetical protein BX616_007448 [Lobosporangium transversale]|nr:hypothetical protein BX616_007448 [Lobosporangium transversale]